MTVTTIKDTQLRELYIKADGTRAFTADHSAGGFKLTNLATPTVGTDATTKNYVDNAITGLKWKDPVRAMSTSNITLSGTQTVDGVALNVNDRVLVNGQTDATTNGFYLVSSGAWTRTVDADASNELSGAVTTITEGTTYGNQQWQLVTDNITLGTTALVFTVLNGGLSITPGNGLTQTGNAFNVNTDPNGAVQIVSNALSVKLSNAQLQTTSSGLSINFARHINPETPTGSVNGTNTAYTLAQTPTTNTLQIFLNGVLQEGGSGNDYTVSGTAVTFAVAPVTGDKVRAIYWY